ncbi:hypothetical protein BC938DRAFT_474056 [Jimgerdemannia flammicorona]|uniref:Uncharacterized protein n=1 Tax=Jimgerdemannia flammicorona TaxID=994334 RepID=A0A433QSV3_9FUNG|nr:hypothetical protein BC938DRAFT_474056 [Jimgerdemannia flammicorona]
MSTEQTTTSTKPKWTIGTLMKLYAIDAGSAFVASFSVAPFISIVDRPPPRSSPLLHATAPLHRDPAVPARPHGLLQHVPDGQHDHDDMRGGLHADIRHDGGAQPPPRVVCAVLLSRRPDRGCELQRAGASRMSGRRATPIHAHALIRAGSIQPTGRHALAEGRADQVGVSQERAGKDCEDRAGVWNWWDWECEVQEFEADSVEEGGGV